MCQVFVPGFAGCMRRFSINDIALEHLTYSADSGISSAQCRTSPATCAADDDDECFGGTCVVDEAGKKCVCGDGFDAPSCRQGQHNYTRFRYVIVELIEYMMRCCSKGFNFRRHLECSFMQEHFCLWNLSSFSNRRILEGERRRICIPTNSLYNPSNLSRRSQSISEADTVKENTRSWRELSGHSMRRIWNVWKIITFHGIMTWWLSLNWKVITLRDVCEYSFISNVSDQWYSSVKDPWLGTTWVLLDVSFVAASASV